MIWVFFIAMLVAGGLVVAWPIWRRSRHFVAASGAVAVIAVTALVYWRIGTPVPPDIPATAEEMVASLEQRLRESPEDIESWRMLGSAYMQVNEYGGAVAAFQQVVTLESAANAYSLTQLGEALLSLGPEHVAQADRQFEAALALEPRNPRALFYGGITAIERGDQRQAADRWETLLALAPPPEIAEILRPRIAEWRGQAGSEAGEGGGSRVAVMLSLDERAAEAVAPDATVYVIARDPAQPAPPIAAIRRRVTDLPAEVSLGDADAMLPGRPLSGFEEIEIIARVSQSGEPTERPGDWYGEGRARMPSNGPVEIVIAHQVPGAESGARSD